MRHWDLFLSPISPTGVKEKGKQTYLYELWIIVCLLHLKFIIYVWMKRTEPQNEMEFKNLLFYYFSMEFAIIRFFFYFCMLIIKKEMSQKFSIKIMCQEPHFTDICHSHNTRNHSYFLYFSRWSTKFWYRKWSDCITKLLCSRTNACVAFSKSDNVPYRRCLELLSSYLISERRKMDQNLIVLIPHSIQSLMWNKKSMK